MKEWEVIDIFVLKKKTIGLLPVVQIGHDW